MKHQADGFGPLVRRNRCMMLGTCTSVKIGFLVKPDLFYTY
ncbi:hypothetical protein NBRC111894_2013 [Sporolactobacillus inulinus]|uniref:Uncharacterized protein n=1 Tax=Sporolactobacillus inulinus TaxID=2078 RepID=A0A4Y1ZBQ7_9BACL|nr:hypothetical protein NBRC111894_2013 [Sporolactobacillus inulinus]